MRRHVNVQAPRRSGGDNYPTIYVQIKRVSLLDIVWIPYRLTGVVLLWNPAKGNPVRSNSRFTVAGAWHGFLLQGDVERGFMAWFEALSRPRESSEASVLYDLTVIFRERGSDGVVEP
uniref:Uncharacterized protein n=1 Tax=Branchiostoma floridae TaxID=7739 RepID=C3YA45_BRAFL|eukprot:XP_002606944.1 hypothetical protein BRAFLDRAFT_91713 [Branchiostoma floridae]